MEHIETIAAVRAACATARAAGRTVALVPTMGALHEGHRSLLRAARRDCDLVVASIFVNPLQFGEGEDLARYPRPVASDLAVCEAEGVDLVFAPTVEEMYPRPALTTVHVARLTEDLCGAARPGHFDGVTTVCTKLFSIVGPCRAYFGRKDAQQLAVVTRMVADLDLPVVVVGCPLVREPDGLALSSRNAYLTATERADAAVLSRALFAAGDAVAAGERAAASVRALVRTVVAAVPSIALEYVEVRTAADLAGLSVLDGEVLLAVAAHTEDSGTRLIDNIGLTIRGDDVAVDRGTKVVSCTGP